MECMKLLLVSVVMIQLTGPNGNRIDVNPHDIVTIREPQVPGFFDAKVKCVLFTLDNQFIGIRETCAQVRELIQSED